MKRQLIRLKEITTVLFTIAAVTTGLIACSLDDDTSDNAPATEMRLYVNGDRYRIPLPATEAINLKSLSTDNKEYFRIENANAFNSITVSPFTEIAKDKQIEIAYTTGGQSGVIRINTRLITEHNADGKEVFGLRRSQDDSKPNSTNASYRCVKYSDN